MSNLLAFLCIVKMFFQKNAEEPKLPLYDFVLVYKEDKNDANKAEKERQVFEENLKNYGMIIDPEEQSDDVGRFHC